MCRFVTVFATDAAGVAMAVSREQIEPLRQLLAGARLVLTLDGFSQTVPPCDAADGSASSSRGD